MQTRQFKAATAAVSTKACYYSAICQNFPHCSRHRSAICLAATSDVQPQSHSSSTLPDVSLDDLLSGTPSPVPADMVASQPSKPKQHKKATRLVDGTSITTRGDNTAAPPGARQRVAQLLQKAKERKAVGTTTATAQQETPASTSATANVEQIKGSSQLSEQELLPRTLAGRLPSKAGERNVELSSVSQPADESGSAQTIPVVSDDVDYGPLQTRRKRRSRLFNLKSDIALPSIAAAVLQPEVVSPVTQPSRSQIQRTKQPLPSQAIPRVNLQSSSKQPSAQAQDTFVSSTKQARRARLKGNQRNRNTNLTDGADVINEQDSSPSPLQTQQSTARQRQQQSRAQSSLGTTLPHNTEQQFPTRPPQQRDQSVMTPSPPVPSYSTTTSHSQGSGFRARSQQSTQTRQSSSQQQTIENNAVSTTAITLDNWRWIAADGWPDIYSPSYHTSLYEFLLDVWLEAGKDLARGSASTAQAAFKLFHQCQQSRAQLLVHTSLIALCDGLADSEDLQEAAIITLPFQGMGDLLYKLVLPLIGVVYPGELTRSDGCFTPLYDAVKRQTVANIDMKTLPAASQLQQSLKTADECLLLLPPDWQTLLYNLLKLQPVHPGVALGPLITLFELDSSAA